MNTASILVLVILIETVTNVLKPLWKNVKYKDVVTYVVAFGVAIYISFAAQADLFKALNVPLTQYFGEYSALVFSGAIYTRGSNYLHDLLKLIKGYSEKIAYRNSTQP